MEDKYIDLILNKCMYLQGRKSVFISYHTFNEEFVNKLVEALKLKGAKDIYLECIDLDYEHELLKTSTLKEIEECKYFDESIYNDYALKKSAFIFIDSPIPGLFNDIEDEKLALMSRIKAETKQIFRALEMRNKISWTIVPLYNKEWEKSLKIDNLDSLLNDILMLNGNPITNWNNYMDKIKKVTESINDKHFEYLHYENKNGTDLIVGLPDNYKFLSVADDKIMVNLPSYEIFTSPNKYKTEGIVYSTKPLYYNGGVIDNFSIEFKEGKAIKCHAKKGKKLLESIINMDEGSCYLGECALVEFNNPIGRTNIVYKATLLDENASCHLALGDGFGDESKKKLAKKGINFSKIHVDFMIGDENMNITGVKDGEKTPIMKSGRFVIK